MKTVNELLADLRRIDIDVLTIIAIDGGGGAGKSTLASRIAAEIPQTQTVHMDDFYRRKADLVTSDGDQNVNFDWERLRGDVLMPVRRGEVGEFHPLIWQEDRYAASPIVVTPRGLLVVEGVMSLRRELRPLYDRKIWLDCPRDVRLARGLGRDGEDARNLWETRWLPAEERYFAAHAPRQAADFIIDSCELDDK
jgi:uridine kinase